MRKNKLQSHREKLEANAAAHRMYAALYDKPAQCQVALKPAVKRAPRTASAIAASKPLEAEILKSILHYLRDHPAVRWVARFNSSMMAIDDNHGQTRYVRSSSQRGLSDILGMLKGGKMFAIEAKRAGQKPMPHQQQFLDLIKDGGGLAGVARSIEDADKIISDR